MSTQDFQRQADHNTDEDSHRHPVPQPPALAYVVFMSAQVPARRPAGSLLAQVSAGAITSSLPTGSRADPSPRETAKAGTSVVPSLSLQH